METSRNASEVEFLAAKEPGGPPNVSVLRMLRGVPREDPLIRWTRMRETWGDVVRYRYGFDDSHFVTHPEGARRILQENSGNYTKAHATYGMLRRLVGNGLLTSDGGFWLRQRRLMQPAFHRARITSMGARMVRAAEATAQRWDELASSGESFSMLKEMSALTVRIVGDALFGTELQAQTRQLSAAWDILNQQMVQRFSSARLIPPILPTAYDRAFRTARRTVYSVTDEIITAKRRGGGDGADLLSMLMAAQDEDSGEKMTDAQLRDEVVTLLVAGHETTAAGLSWAWALLDQNPSVRRKMQDELWTELGDRPATAEDFPKLRYTRAVVDEALRLWPPAFILFRRIEENDVVCGHRMHKGGTVVMSPMVFHRHPAFWDLPDAFVPDRWLDAEAEKTRPRFAYMPFSGGPRQCIGNTFAVMEAVLILATLARKFSPSLVDGQAPRPEYLVTLRPSNGLPMRLRRAAAITSTGPATHPAATP